MFLKVMWNRGKDFPEFTLVSCKEVIVNRTTYDDLDPLVDESYVHVMAGEFSVCLKRNRSFAYVLNENGKTIETIRA